MSLESYRDIVDLGIYWNSVYESNPENDKIGVAFGTYASSERLIATIEDLLSSQFYLNDLCVVGRVRSLSHSLHLLQKQLHGDVSHLSLFTRTESFFGDGDVASGVGSKGRLLETLKGLMQQRPNGIDAPGYQENSIDCPELKKQIGEGNQTLFVCTDTPDMLVPALRILLRRSSFNVRSIAYF